MTSSTPGKPNTNGSRLLAGVLTLHNIRDTEALCRSILNDHQRGRPLNPTEYEDLLTWLIEEAWWLSTRYQPHRDKATTKGRQPSFADYATAVLRQRIRGGPISGGRRRTHRQRRAQYGDNLNHWPPIYQQPISLDDAELGPAHRPGSSDTREDRTTDPFARTLERGARHPLPLQRADHPPTQTRAA